MEMIAGIVEHVLLGMFGTYGAMLASLGAGIVVCIRKEMHYTKLAKRN